LRAGKRQGVVVGCTEKQQGSIEKLTSQTKTVKPKGAAYFVAEKGSDTATFGKLEPVEFRNLAYLKDYGWHSVTELYTNVECGVNTNCNDCGCKWERHDEDLRPATHVNGRGQTCFR
jgi:hypothetical protein